MSELTLTELANNIGVSKSAINQKVNQEDKDRYFRKVGNKYLVNEQGQKAIKLMFKTTITTSEAKDKQKELLESILKDSEEKSEEIKEKNKQIEKMQKLLDQQQQLHLQANQRIEHLEKQLAIEPPKDREQPLLSEKNKELEKQLKEKEDKIKEQNEFIAESNEFLGFLRDEYGIENIEDVKNSKPKRWYQFWK